MTDKLAVDLYAGDGNYDLQAFADAGDPWALVAFKLSQGNYYNGGEWAARMFPAARRVLGERYGKSAFRVAYHYLDVGIAGIANADYFLKQYAACGGVGYGDPFVMVDIERASQRRPFARQEIVDTASAFVERVRAALGLRVVVYGGEYLRAYRIKIAEFGCEYAWVADYEETLRPDHYELLGVDLPHLLAWQYGGLEGDGHEEAHLQGYPWTSPAGLADLSALTLAGGGQAAIDELASWCVREVK